METGAQALPTGISHLARVPAALLNAQIIGHIVSCVTIAQSRNIIYDSPHRVYVTISTRFSAQSRLTR